MMVDEKERQARIAEASDKQMHWHFYNIEIGKNLLWFLVGVALIVAVMFS